MQPSQWETYIDRLIREAREAGKFDNLAGAGKRLELRDVPFADPAWRTIRDVLDEVDFVPDWVTEGREIQSDYEELQAALARTLAWCTERRAALPGGTTWRPNSSVI